MPLFDLTDDLELHHFHQLLIWLCVNKLVVTRANIKGWRKSVNLPVDEGIPEPLKEVLNQRNWDF
jgi:hypothetical protein